MMVRLRTRLAIMLPSPLGPIERTSLAASLSMQSAYDEVAIAVEHLIDAIAAGSLCLVMDWRPEVRYRRRHIRKEGALDHDPNQRDVDVVLHSISGVGVAAATGTCLFYVVPDLFDRHSTAGDMGALAVVIGSLAFAYLAGRRVWRSFRVTATEDRK